MDIDDGLTEQERQAAWDDLERDLQALCDDAELSSLASDDDDDRSSISSDGATAPGSGADGDGSALFEALIECMRNDDAATDDSIRPVIRDMAAIVGHDIAVGQDAACDGACDVGEQTPEASEPASAPPVQTHPESNSSHDEPDHVAAVLQEIERRAQQVQADLREAEQRRAAVLAEQAARDAERARRIATASDERARMHIEDAAGTRDLRERRRASGVEQSRMAREDRLARHLIWLEQLRLDAERRAAAERAARARYGGCSVGVRHGDDWCRDEAARERRAMAMEETAIRVGKRRARAERDRMTAEDATGERERQRWRRERTRMTVALRAARATRERDRMVAQDALSRAARERERHEERSRRRALRESARRRPSTVEGCPLPAPPAGDDPILASLALKPGAGVPIAPSCDLPVRVPLCGSLPEQRPALICEQASRRHGRLYETLPAFAARRERFFALRIQRWWVHVRPRCRAARHVQAWYRGRRNRRQCLGILRGTRTGANGDPIERLDDSFFDFLQDDGSDVLALLESGNVVFADTPGGSPRAPPCEGQATEPPRQLPMPGGHRSPSPDGTRSSPVPAPSRLDSAPGECAKSACDDVFGGSTTNESVDGGLAASESGCAIDELVRRPWPIALPPWMTDGLGLGRSGSEGIPETSETIEAYRGNGQLETGGPLCPNRVPQETLFGPRAWGVHVYQPRPRTAKAHACAEGCASPDCVPS